MHTLMVVGLSICAPLTAIGLYSLQRRLERWDYERHADD
ncbi:DUF2189 domain-containing protein [Mycobacterium barrassiae]|nr:DUF2189 domain-containing protein [Mycobacterium barrassiae]